MANTVQFDLVSPERLLVSVEASAVQIPGTEGDMTAMPDHAPLITTMRPGILKVSSAQGEQDFVVTGGFAEINAASISVLAEQAIPRDEVTQAQFDVLSEGAAAKLAKARETAQGVDEAAKLVADIAALGGEIGLSAA